ncbi:acetate transporter [Schizosaccharomyces japonicus yFS275]|uniref:Acetate transporter n=1 Tax=Schizosaccharomyces japonicus (strain yFS275 / FY16936) TaxID=402676 RepID=B6JY46_SCHJY|nr:acetate transporter [Schizosaccharomyces japonicus yFS275]EEB06464.1 acetate transporter [Schizosaccharomyces japonicus yFS275]
MTYTVSVAPEERMSAKASEAAICDTELYGSSARPVYDQAEHLASQIAELQHRQKMLFGPSAADFEPMPHRLRYNTLGNPAPLGLFSFAFTTFLLSLFNLHTDDILTSNMIITVAVFYGGMAQVLVSMWELASGNTFGAAVFGSYGSFWLSFAAINIPFFNVASAYKDPAELTHAIGLYLMCWFVFTFLVMLCTTRSTLAFFLLFVSLDITFLLLGIAHLVKNASTSSHLLKAGGAFGIATAVIAWYNAMAGLASKENSFFTVPRVTFPWSVEGLSPEEAQRRRMQADGDAKMA